MRCRYVLCRAWEIVRRNKVLWLSGLLASLTTSLNVDPESEILVPAYPWIEAFVSGPSFRPVAMGLLQAFTFAGLLAIFVAAAGRTALVSQVHQVGRGTAPSVRTGWDAIERCGGRVYGIALLLGVPRYLLVAIGWLPFLAPVALALFGPASAKPGSLADLVPWTQWYALSVPVSCLGLLLGELLGALGALAERACVVEGLSVRQSITRGWQILNDRIRSVAALWLVLAGVRVGVFLASALPLLLIVAGALLPFKALVDNTSAAALVAYACGLSLSWLLRVALGALTGPFYSACWTLAYRQLSAPVGSGDAVVGQARPSLDLTGLRPGSA